MMGALKSNKKRLWIIVAAAVLVAAVVIGSILLLSTGGNIRVAIDPQNMSLEVGQTQRLKLVSEDGTEQKLSVQWSSSAPAIASVTDSGLVTAVSPGETKINAVVTVRGREYFVSAGVTVTKASAVRIEVSGDDVKEDPEIKGKQFTLYSASAGVMYDMDAGIIQLTDEVKQSEIIFANSMNNPYADAWELRGTVNRKNSAQSLFLSFGVKDESGKEQWFCIYEDAMARQRYWNWADTKYELDGTYVGYNDAAVEFFWRRADRLDYILVLQDDVLKLYFGSNQYDMALAWSLPLTKDIFGGFEAGTSYLVGINTVDPCDFEITDISTKNGEDVEDPGGSVSMKNVDVHITGDRFRVDSASKGISTNASKGTITTNSLVNQTELIFAAGKNQKYSDSWEMTGTIKKADITANLFLSFGIKDSSGKEQWFCMLDNSSISLQRYYNWWDSEYFADGVYVLENAAADLFYDKKTDCVNYRLVVANDAFKMYFGSHEQELTLAWALPLTDAEFGGFQAGSQYQIGINTVDPNVLYFTDVTVKCGNGVGNDSADDPEVIDGDPTFYIAQISDGVKAYAYKSKISYSASEKTELFFGADAKGGYARNWEISGQIVRWSNMPETMLSFGVRDSSGKTQWFSIYQHMASLDTTGDNVLYDGTHVKYNDAATLFYWRTLERGGLVLNYRITIEDDLLIAWFGNEEQDLGQAWYFPLTDTQFGGFTPGSAYQIGIHTADNCAMTVYDTVAIALDDKYGDYRFYVERESSGVSTKPMEGLITISNSASQTEMMFAANKQHNFAKSWEVTGKVKKENVQDNLFLSFGVHGYGGTSQWLCILQNGLSRQRYWNWWDTEYRYDGTYVIENTAARSFYDKETDTLYYKLVLENDVLKAYFGSTPDYLTLTWNLSLTEDLWGGFEPGTAYQIGITTVDPCSLRISDVTVKTDESVSGGYGVQYDPFSYRDNANRQKEKLEAGVIDGVTTVFIGDSFHDQDGFRTFTDLYGDKEALCCGIGGTSTNHWVTFMNDWFQGYDFKNIVVNIGTNNLGRGDYTDVVIADLQEFFLKLKQAYPNSNIYWFSIALRSDMSREDAKMKINAAMKQWCEENGVIYVENPIENPETDCSDGLHPNAASYEKYATELAKAGCVMVDKDLSALRFYVASETGHWVDYDERAGKIWYMDTDTTELFFGADENGSYADSWQLTGDITRSFKEGMLLSFGVRDASGKTQWFSIKEHAAGLDNEGNDPIYDDVHAWWNEPSCNFYWNNTSVLSYKITVVDDVLCAYFGTNPDNLQQAWYFPLTDNRFGNFAENSQYQLGIFTRETCDMDMTDVSVVTGDAVEGEVVDASRYDVSQYSQKVVNRKQRLQSEVVDGVTTVFIGDSFFDEAELFKNFFSIYHGKEALCLGISGSTTQHWVTFTNDWLDDYSPKNIVVNIGTNNLGYGDKTGYTLSGLQELLALLKEKFPDSHVYWFAIAPRSDIDREAVRVSVNEAMKQWCGENGVIYMENPVEDPATDCFDGLHPTLDKYWEYAQALENAGCQIADKVAGDDRFYISGATDGIFYSADTGEIGFDGTQDTTELFFAADENGSYASDWQLTGMVSRTWTESMILSFGVKDSTGKTQWFSIKEHAAGLDNEGNNPVYDEVHAWWNEPMCSFYWQYPDFMTISYKITVEDDVLRAYFGTDSDHLQQVWYFPLTEAQFGGFAADTQYQLGIFTRKSCAMSMTDVDVTAVINTGLPEDSKFFISSISSGVSANPTKGKIVYDGNQNTTELFFAADENGSYSAGWELTGTVTRENVEGMLLSFGVKDKNGKTQWFSIKEHAAGLDNQGNNPIYDDVHAWWNYSSCAFYWRYADSMTISYKITVHDDVLCAYFGPAMDSLAQAWYFPLTDAQFGGFASGTDYQLGIFTRVACKMEMTNVSVMAQTSSEAPADSKFFVDNISNGVTATPSEGKIVYDGTQDTTELFFGADENGGYAHNWELTGTVTRENVESMILSFGVKDTTGKNQWFSIKEHAAGLDNEGNNTVYDDTHAWWNYAACAFYWRYEDAMTINYKITVVDDVLRAYFGKVGEDLQQAWYFPLTDSRYGGFVAGTEYQLGMFTRVACKLDMTNVNVIAGGVQQTAKFHIAKATNVTFDQYAGTLTTDGVNNTETYFSSNASGGYAASWEMTGKITKANAADNLFFSFGVKNSSGKDQWFCILENGLSRQRYWNWWDTEYKFDGVYAIENAAAKSFYQHNTDTLYYKLVVENDVLKLYFGATSDDLTLSWNLPLTEALWGGFSTGTKYQLGINTVDPCKLTVSELTVSIEEEEE